jgi:hypothetical protein
MRLAAIERLERRGAFGVGHVARMFWGFLGHDADSARRTTAIS